MLSKLRIGPKLLLAPGVVLILLVLLSAGAYYGMVRQNQSLDDIVQQRAARMKAAAALVAGANRAHTQTYQLLTWINASFSGARVDGLVRDMHQRHAGLQRQFGELVKVTEPAGAERRFVEQAEAAHATYVKAVLDVIEIAQSDQSVGTSAMVKAERAFDVVALRLEQLSRLEQELSEQAFARAEADFRRLSVMMPLVVTVSIALSLAVSMLVRRELLKEVREIGDAAVDLASGNLTPRERSYGSDEIAETSRTLDESIRNLNATLKGILASARSIGNASREIAAGNSDLSQRTEAQASSLEQTAGSMEQLTATVQQTATNAQLANQLADCATTFAARGGNLVQRLALSMATMRGTSGRVADIVGVIDAIAAQTGNLALNAAVEAARAGEQGDGFVTVATEVRQLAQRSAAAAREARALIAQSVSEIEGGSAWVQEAGISMADIVASVQQVGEIIRQISSASSDQAGGIDGVNQAIVQLDQMTQQNSVLVEEAAAAAETLQHQALNLSQAVAGFKLDDLVPPLLPDGGVGGRAHLRLASKRA